MKLHWKILIWLAAGVVVGAGLKAIFPPDGALLGATFPSDPTEPARVESASGDAAKADLAAGDVIVAIIFDKDRPTERLVSTTTIGDLKSTLSDPENGRSGVNVWLRLADGSERRMTTGMAPESVLEKVLVAPRFGADVFMRLLKMLIIPLVLTSIISGIAGIGGGADFGRLGRKTLLYYLTTSALAAAVGLVLINLFSPGVGATLGLPVTAGSGASQDVWQVLREAIPPNIFHAFSDPANRQMLQVIIFAILFGFFIGKTKDRYSEPMKKFFDSAFEVMMTMARWVMSLVPYGVFCLLVKVVAETGVAVFEPLLMYMFVITLGLVLHCCVTLPALLRFVGGVSPLRWAKAMSPALLTAFSTSSSAGTLPVTLETVEEQGKVSNRTASFVLPLGATVNMDGTALYECAGVIFLAQYYGSVNPDMALTLSQQIFVVLLALLASIGAAGIPSAGLVMMATILSALDMPTEGAALLLAVDRPLDMLRTVTNVWSDSCGAAIIAASEGENIPAQNV